MVDKTVHLVDLETEPQFDVIGSVGRPRVQFMAADERSAA